MLRTDTTQEIAEHIEADTGKLDLEFRCRLQKKQISPAFIKPPALDIGGLFFAPKLDVHRWSHLAEEKS